MNRVGQEYTVHSDKDFSVRQYIFQHTVFSFLWVGNAGPDLTAHAQSDLDIRSPQIT